MAGRHASPTPTPVVATADPCPRHGRRLGGSGSGRSEHLSRAERWQLRTGSRPHRCGGSCDRTRCGGICHLVSTQRPTHQRHVRIDRRGRPHFGRSSRWVGQLGARRRLDSRLQSLADPGLGRGRGAGCCEVTRQLAAGRGRSTTGRRTTRVARSRPTVGRGPRQRCECHDRRPDDDQRGSRDVAGCRCGGRNRRGRADDAGSSHDDGRAEGRSRRCRGL